MKLQEKLTLREVKQVDKVLNGRWPVRIYATDEVEFKGSLPGHVRYHIGLPEELLVLERYCYPKEFETWWKRTDGYYIFDVCVSRPAAEQIPLADLSQCLKGLLLKLMRIMAKQTTLA